MLANDPNALILENIQMALAPYSKACYGGYCN